MRLATRGLGARGGIISRLDACWPRCRSVGRWLLRRTLEPLLLLLAKGRLVLLCRRDPLERLPERRPLLRLLRLLRLLAVTLSKTEWRRRLLLLLLLETAVEWLLIGVIRRSIRCGIHGLLLLRLL